MNQSIEKENDYLAAPQLSKPIDTLQEKDLKENAPRNASELQTLSSQEVVDPKSILQQKDVNKNGGLNRVLQPRKNGLKNPDISEKPTEPEFLKDVLKFNVDKIDFGNLYPGQICEHSLEIFNKNKTNLSFKIRILCLNEKFDELDEYVFSMRRVGGYEYGYFLQ